MTQVEIEAATFDVRRDGWIPIVYDDGTTAELGLEAALATAHEWSAIADPLPTVEFGLYRLLVAFVLDIFAPQDGADWNQLWQQERFDAEAIAAYFDEHEGAFDLFGAKPFLQSAGMPKETLKPVASLAHSIPSGSYANHFHHGSEALLQLSPAAAARWLTAVSPFAIQGGRSYFTGINGSPPWYVLPLGNNGFETLMLNVPVLSDLLQCSGDETPAWRSLVPIGTKKLTEASLLKALTWRPRRVQLIADDSGGLCSATGKESDVIIKNIFYAGGEGAEFNWTDPNAAYRTADKRLPLKPLPGREVWRDTGPLALLKQKPLENKKEVIFERPAIISQISELVKATYLEPEGEFRIALYGLRCEEANIFEWQRENLSVPVELLWEDVEANEAQTAMQEAEQVAYRLTKSIRAAAPPKKPNGTEAERMEPRNPKALQTLVDQATTLFWRQLRAHYDDLLRLLATKPDEATRKTELQNWRYTLRDEGWRALRFAIDDLDGDAKALKRQTNAYANFGRAIWPVIEPQKATEAKARREAKKKEKTT